jgi:TIR domain
VDPQIFITYSSKDQKVARTICTALENRGLACWISFRNVKPGQNYQEQIVKAIRTAKIMVLVFTANANNSNEIKKELALASQHNLIVIPVRIEDVTPSEAFAYEFATRQWIDLFGDWENSITRLVEMIAAAISEPQSGNGIKAGLLSAGGASAPASGKSTAESAPATGPASFLRQPSTRWALIAGLAAIVVAVVAYEAGTSRQQRSPTPVTTSGGSQAQPPPVPASPVPGQTAAPPQPVPPPLPPPPPAPTQPAALPAAPDITGTYAVHGTNPNGTSYRGSVTVRRDGDHYRFVWLIASGDTYQGTGVLNGRTITVDWGQRYPVIYNVGPNGVLTGTWNNGTATETLVPN